MEQLGEKVPEKKRSVDSSSSIRHFSQQMSASFVLKRERKICFRSVFKRLEPFIWLDNLGFFPLIKTFRDAIQKKDDFFYLVPIRGLY